MNPVKKIVFLVLSALALTAAMEDHKVNVSGKIQFRDEYSSTSDSAFNAVKVKGYSEIKGGLGEFFETGFRITTQKVGNKKSAHVDLNTGFEKMTPGIDRAYINIVVNPELKMHLGKTGFLFKDAGLYSQHAWDKDIQPEGIALKFDHKTEENDWVKSGGFVASLYVMDNLGKGKDIPTLSANQVFLEVPLKKIAMLDMATAGYFYFHPQTPSGENHGMEYHILHQYISAKFGFTPVPWEIKFENFYNYMTDRDNLGFVMGAGVGRKEKLGDVFAFFQGQYIGERAVNPAFSQGDFGAASDYWGYLLGLRIGLDPKVNLAFKILSTNPQREENWNFKARMDMTAKF